MLSTDGSAVSTTSVSHAGPVPLFYEAMRYIDRIGHSRRASATILRSEAFYTAGYHADPISMSGLNNLDVSLHVELVNLTGIYDGQAIFEVGNKNLLWKARADKMLECIQRSIGTHASDSWSRARQAGSSVQSLNSDVSILVTSPSPAAENFFLSLWHNRLLHRNVVDLCKAILQSHIVVGDVSQLKFQYRSSMTESVCAYCA
jgi:hypothetical protein